MDCVEADKGDSSENCDPNSTPVNDKPATKLVETSEECENVKPKVDYHQPVLPEDVPMKNLRQPPPEEMIEFKVIFNKSKHDITFGWDQTVRELKLHLELIIGVVQNAQKILIKGMAKDDNTLRESGLVKGGKVMVIGSKMNDILSVTNCKQQCLIEEKTAGSSSSKEPLSDQKIHKKILDKGVPPDVMPGTKGSKEPLPPVPLSGMLNKHGGKVRLTFKLESDQLWLGTKERTEKLSLTSIKGITSEPIKEHEEYHIMGIQLGPTEASRYWVYWVPAQYIEAIKDAVLGKWQLF